MKVRICTAIVGIIAVLVLVWLGSWPFTAACVAAGIISFREYARMMKEIDVHTFSKSAYAAIIIMLCASGFLRYLTGYVSIPQSPAWSFRRKNSCALLSCL